MATNRYSRSIASHLQDAEETQPSSSQTIISADPGSAPISCSEYEEEKDIPWKHKASLGAGGYGIVDKVVYDGDGPYDKGTSYARKRQEEESMFQEELESLSIFRESNHPHLITLIDAYYYRFNYYLILSPVAECHLGDFLDKMYDKFSRTSERFNILSRGFGCLADGLAFLHSKGIRHRDIKPANILVRKDKFIFSDFGLACVFPSDQSYSRGPATGNQKYAAPEMKDSNKHNRKADVFSLGCIYLEMIAAFRKIYPKDKSAWPLFGKGGRVYSEHIGEFRQWLKTPKEPPPATQHSYVQEAIIDLCYMAIEHDQEQRIDSYHLYYELCAADNSSQSNNPLFCVECKKARQYSNSSVRAGIGITERLYCSQCQAGPFFTGTDKPWKCPHCKPTYQISPIKFGSYQTPIKNDRGRIAEWFRQNVTANASSNIIEQVLSIRLF
ncbi:kinase-like domain-containing protein [Cenococcum geophilum]